MAVDRSQLGRRYSCFSCGCKFYELNRDQAICPRCEADQEDDPAPDPRVAAMAASKKARSAAAKAAPAEKAPTPQAALEVELTDPAEEEVDLSAGPADESEE